MPLRSVAGRVREFEFVVRFEPGADDLMDVFHEHPGLTGRSSVCVTTDESMWRIDHLQGPPGALSAVESVFTDETRCNECLDDASCDTYREYHALDRTSGGLTVYTLRREVHRCHSVPYIVYDHVGEGSVFEARRVGGEYHWKVLYPNDQPVGELYDAIDDELREGLTLEVSHLREAGKWDPVTRTAADLDPDDWEVLEAAYEAGYYSRPRDTTVAELSEALDVPRSTLQYRLRNAEDALVSQFVETVR